MHRSTYAVSIWHVFIPTCVATHCAVNLHSAPIGFKPDLTVLPHPWKISLLDPMWSPRIVRQVRPPSRTRGPACLTRRTRLITHLHHPTCTPFHVSCRALPCPPLPPETLRLCFPLLQQSLWVKGRSETTYSPAPTTWDSSSAGARTMRFSTGSQ